MEALVRENAMQFEKSIDDLIEAGWMVIRSDFDEGAFENWRTKASVCLDSLLGPEHTYAQYFRDHVRHSAESSLLTGVGILTAAGSEPWKPNGSPESPY